LAHDGAIGLSDCHQHVVDVGGLSDQCDRRAGASKTALQLLLELGHVQSFVDVDVVTGWR
jgi:hypothetical protein